MPVALLHGLIKTLDELLKTLWSIILSFSPSSICVCTCACTWTYFHKGQQNKTKTVSQRDRILCDIYFAYTAETTMGTKRCLGLMMEIRFLKRVWRVLKMHRDSQSHPFIIFDKWSCFQWQCWIWTFTHMTEPIHKQVAFCSDEHSSHPQDRHLFQAESHLDGLFPSQYLPPALIRYMLCDSPGFDKVRDRAWKHIHLDGHFCPSLQMTSSSDFRSLLKNVGNKTDPCRTL